MKYDVSTEKTWRWRSHSSSRDLDFRKSLFTSDWRNDWFYVYWKELIPYYCKDNGRPSIHPISLLKMIFIGDFYGIRSERQLTKEI